MRAILVLLVALPALAGETPPPAVAAPSKPAPREGLFFEPALGASLLSISGPGLFAPAVAVVPELRVGVLGPSFGWGGTLGLGFTTAVPGGLFPQLFLGGNARYFFSPLFGGRLYGSAQGGFASIFGGAGAVIPGFGLDVGVGFNAPLLDKLGVSCEAGVRSRFFFNAGAIEPTIGLNLTFAAQYFPSLRGPAPVVVLADQTPKTVEEDETPGLTPLPEPTFGSSTPPCTTWLTDGWMSPTQGVWQDDPSFADKPTKQLTKQPGTPATYTAELNMVKGKDTLLFGVDHYQLDGSAVKVGARDAIVLRGQSTCTTLQPVKLEVKLRDGYDRTQTIHSTEVIGQVPLEGPVLPAPRWWEVRLPVPTGIPAQPFKLRRPTYRVFAELVKSDGGPTGLRVIVDGRTQESTGPHVTVVPVTLTQNDEQREETFRKLTGWIVEESAEKIPDLFPLAPRTLPVTLAGQRGFQDLDIPSIWFAWRRSDATVAALADALTAEAFLSNAGRVLAVLGVKDFETLFGEGAAGMTVGAAVTPKRSSLTLSWKVMLMPATETWTTVGHELLHTLPEGWADAEMTAECGFEYHNEKTPVAHGVRITEDGKPVAAAVKSGKIALMGPAVSEDAIWITQCTYWHLLKQFAGGGPADPPVLVLRAMFAKRGAKYEGELRPTYSTMGVVDHHPGKGGHWAFVVRDAKGAELGRYPFNPRFTDPHTETERLVQAYAMRVLEPPGWAQIELVGPNGVLATQKASAAPPELTVTAPADQSTLTGETVRVEWQTNVAAPRVSVLTSTDEGRTWVMRAFEQKGVTSLDVAVDPAAKQQRVKVIVTDGTRSAEVQVRVSR